MGIDWDSLTPRQEEAVLTVGRWIMSSFIFGLATGVLFMGLAFWLLR